LTFWGVRPRQTCPKTGTCGGRAGGGLSAPPHQTYTLPSSSSRCAARPHETG
jgi:hypothetical protein